MVSTLGSTPANLSISYSSKNGLSLDRHPHALPLQLLQSPVHHGQCTFLNLEPTYSLRAPLDLLETPLNYIGCPYPLPMLIRIFVVRKACLDIRKKTFRRRRILTAPVLLEKLYRFLRMLIGRSIKYLAH